MSRLDVAWLHSTTRQLPPVDELLALADELARQRRLGEAATALDAAFQLAPDDPAIARRRRRALDQQRVEAHGLLFRYIPAGPFLMGSTSGDPDEQPVHALDLDAFWLTDVPITWSAYCALRGWSPPPEGRPADHSLDGDAQRDEYFALVNGNKVRRQYDESETLEAHRTWHAHAPDEEWQRGTDARGEGGEVVTGRELFGDVERRDPRRPWTYDQKPMVAVTWAQAVALGEALSDEDHVYRLPTEAEWEKAARGGLVGRRYPWGDEPPTPERCDSGRFESFALRPPRELPPNGYGLHGMSGGVREWTADGYDALAYHDGARVHPAGPARPRQRVVRGGSWADCAWSVRVSFRAGLAPDHAADPTVGFRLCRARRSGR